LKGPREDEILQLAEEAIVTGYPDGTFKADEPITRAELASIVTRAVNLAPALAERPSAGSVPALRALDADHHPADAAGLAGYPDGTFRPDEQITRAEMTAMVQRAVNSLHGLAEQLPAGWEPTFSDLGSDHWAFAAAELAYQEGILPPYVREEGFQPDEEAT